MWARIPGGEPKPRIYGISTKECWRLSKFFFISRPASPASRTPRTRSQHVETKTRHPDIFFGFHQDKQNKIHLHSILKILIILAIYPPAWPPRLGVLEAGEAGRETKPPAWLHFRVSFSLLGTQVICRVPSHHPGVHAPGWRGTLCGRGRSVAVG